MMTLAPGGLKLYPSSVEESLILPCNSAFHVGKEEESGELDLDDGVEDSSVRSESYMCSSL